MKRLIAVILLLIVACPTWAQLSDAALGKPNSVTLSGSNNTVKVSTDGNTVKVDQTTAGANDVDTDSLGTGHIGSVTLDVGIVTPVSIGTLTAGTKYIEITPKTTALLGGASLATDSARPLTAGTTYTYKVSTTTPVMYVLSTVSTTTVHVAHYK